jgi:hypothetical protein
VGHSSGTAGRRRPSRWALALAALAAVALALRLAAALALDGPWLQPDEGAYALLGRGFWHHADLAVLGGPSQYASALYPVLAGLPLLAGPHGGYVALRVLQVLVLCATAFVVYGWARRVARPRWAFAAGALTLALPALAYGGEVLAETLLFPLAAVAGLLALRALDVPTRRNQLLLVLALGACVLTRAEANMLVPALLAAAVAAKRLRALWPTWAALAAVSAVWLGLGGGSPLRSLGSYGASPGYSLHGVLVAVLEHAGTLLLVSGVVPVCAAVLLALARPRDRAVRAATAYALALGVVASVEVGVFAAAHAGHLLERELVFTLPAFLVAFAAWLEHDDGRVRASTVAVAAAELAVLLAMPFGKLASAAIAPDNPTLVPLTHLDGPKVYGVVALVALGAAAGLLWARGARAWILPALLAAVFAATSVSAALEFSDRARAARAADAGAPARWIDGAAAGPVAYLYDGGSSSALAWTQLYWNERVTAVLDLTSVRVAGPLPQAQLQLLGDDGTLRVVGGAPARAALIAAPSGFHFRGTRLASSARIGFSLWSLDGPPRVRTWAQGLERNGDLAQGGVATLDVFDCGRGTFHLVAVGRDDETLRLAEGGDTLATTTLWPDGVFEQTIATPARPPGGRCTFSLTSSSLVHLQAFGWRPLGGR